MTEVEKILSRYRSVDEVPTIAELHILWREFGEVTPCGTKNAFTVTPEGQTSWRFSDRYHAWDCYYARYINKARNPW